MTRTTATTPKIIVLGGDGFCGWPTSLHLSALGHEVVIVENLSRRNIDNELKADSLTPIRPMGTRICISYWNIDRRASAHAAEQHDPVQIREAKQK